MLRLLGKTMTEIFIRQRYRDEFDGLTLEEMQARIRAGIWDRDKQMHAQAYVDEKEHGEERSYRAAQISLQKRADIKGTIALLISLGALAISAAALYFTYESQLHGRSPSPPPAATAPQK
jgi:hypothetical protein